MMLKNEFSEKLKELIHYSGVKQQSIAYATGYDLSYVSKWTSGKMLPSEKTIEATAEAISLCIFESANKDWLEERYNKESRKLNPSAIEKELLEAYYESKSLPNKNVSLYKTSLPSKTFYNLIYKVIDESEEIVLILDFFAMNKESRQIIIGLEDGYYKKQTYASIPTKKVTLIINAAGSRDVCYDAISLIHLITIFSRFDFGLTNGRCASGKAIAVAPNKIISGFILGDNNKIFSVSRSDDIDSGNDLQNEFLRVSQNVGFVYLKRDMTTFTNGKDYLKSMMSTNIKWIQGHITELIMPDGMYEKLLIKNNNISYDEAQRIHIFSKNIIEQGSINLLIYETALSDLIATGEVDFYNNKIILTSEEIEEYIQFLMEVVQTSNVYLISNPLFAEFKHAFSPCLYISDTICYLRIEGAYERDNIYEIVDRTVRDLFDRLYSEIISNRKDAIITEKRIILERLENYKMMAGIPSVD